MLDYTMGCAGMAITNLCKKPAEWYATHSAELTPSIYSGQALSEAEWAQDGWQPNVASAPLT